jgi:5-methylcytosine-specific restriction endonuclease McrA
MVDLISTCKQCSSKNIDYKETEYEIGYYCNDCDIIFTEKKQFDGCCGFPNIQTMQVATANGFSYRNICQNCFTTILVIKKTDKPIGKIINISLDDLNKNKFLINKNSIYSELLNIKTNNQQNKKNAFWINYKEYLKSERWQNKRLKVLERDKYLCQACLRNKATQAHHLTYERVFDEPLFDLISICTPCHEKLHNK